jgi:catechol 2,3-dioxygenase-like lactoylglutathione lyase family enzyme
VDLGAFSISLSVADLSRSLAFYRTLGFEVIDGEPDGNWVILRNGNAILVDQHGE